MNIAAIRNSALSSIDEQNNLPTWKGGAWPGGSSLSSSGVSGLGVSGQYLQGLINLISDGNITLIQNGQQITVSGSSQNSQLIGSYVSGLGIANNLLTGAITLSGLGSISLSQNGQIIYISGGNSQISDYFGVTGIRVSGDSISGAISFTQAGNVYLIQNGNNIIISGKESLSTGSSTGVAIGGVTGVGVSGNFTTGGINLKSAGSITLFQDGQDITISGNISSQGGTVISSTGDGIYISLGNTGGQILNSGVFNAINWNSGIRSGILSFNQTEPSKIYIQTGCSGYYSISAYVNLNNNDLFDNYVWKKNGTNYLTNKSSNIANAYLNDGDYLEFYVNPVYSTSISGDINCDISNIKTVGGGSNLPTGSGYLYNDGNDNISWNTISQSNTKPFIVLTTSGGQPLTNNTWIKFFWSGAIYNDGMSFSGSDIYIPSGQDGMYLLSANFEVNNGNPSDIIGFVINNSKYISNENNSAYSYRRKSITCIEYLTGNSFVNLQYFSSVDTTVLNMSSWNNWPRLKISKI